MGKRILVTGAGGPAAISFMKAVRHMSLEIHAADMDTHAAGLYLVSATRRIIIPPGAALDFAEKVLEVCQRRDVDILVPTVDSELIPLALARKKFEKLGVRLLMADAETLKQCLDKWLLAKTCSQFTRVPKTTLFNEDMDLDKCEYPLIVKPRVGSGSRGIHIVKNRSDLELIEKGSHLLVQEYLPGAEYSVDVLASKEGEIIAAVPRERLKIDSGVAVAGRTVYDPELIKMAECVARAIKLKFVANIQFKRDGEGRPALLEVNPRFPGTMPLTVAAGVNMPALSLENLLGTPISKEKNGDFKEVAVVRYWQEQFIEIDEILALGN